MFIIRYSWSRMGYIHPNWYNRNTRFMTFIPIDCLTQNTRLYNLSSDWSVNRYRESLKHLQIGEECSLEEARAAYIKLAKLYHPDSRSSYADAKKFSETRNAYLTVLKTNTTRIILIYIRTISISPFH